METTQHKITLTLDGDAEINVKGFIAPIEYTQYNFHVEWDELANFRVAEPEKQYPDIRLSKHFFHRNRFRWVNVGRLKKQTCWNY